ncbi:hypothetical protein ILYODFUR_015656 [Ilyodon furcidens]|uniref:Uncharacterized protein n=1 Tax=Ilyodon furcidens TaxID=33524 RepID=A0ABV0SZ17_9TELE
MSFKTVGTLLTLTLRATGNRTPPLARSPRVNRLSTSCRVFAGSQHVEKNKGQSCSSDSDRPNDGDVPLSSEPPHKCGNGDKKRLKEAAGAPGASDVRRRSFTSKAAPMDQTSFLWNRYNDLKRLVYGKHRIPLCPHSPHAPRRKSGTPLYTSSSNQGYVSVASEDILYVSYHSNFA